MATTKTIDHATPNGGVRSQALYHDGRGNMMDDSEATHVNILEFDAKGELIHTTYGYTSRYRGDQTENAFCATGSGGGIDPSCSPHGDGAPGEKSSKNKHVGAAVDAAVHAVAEGAKHHVANLIGGIPEELTKDAGQKDKKPYDVKLQVRGRPDQDIEVKSMSVGGKQEISVHADALMRKVEHAQRTGNGFHTVVMDYRETHDSGSNAGNYSGNWMYYKRGSGRYTLANMHPVKDERELKKLILADDSKLPDKARGSLPPPPPVDKLKESASKDAESRKARDKARKELNKDKLREQARARAAKKRAEKGSA